MWHSSSCTYRYHLQQSTSTLYLLACMASTSSSICNMAGRSGPRTQGVLHVTFPLFPEKNKTHQTQPDQTKTDPGSDDNASVS
jgi:hypothetical protein